MSRLNDNVCPGMYCGRIQFDNETFSECGPCPLGYRSTNNFFGGTNSICIKCTDSLELYDYLFLIFIFISQLTFEFYIIDRCVKRSILTFETIILYMCSFVETTLAAGLSWYIYAIDYLDHNIKTCKSLTILDWYTLIEDPVQTSSTNGNQLRCSREIVYPLYSLPFCYLFLSFIFLLSFRSLVIRSFQIQNSSLSIYLTMYLIPIIAIIHFIFAGVLYYFYPYFLLVGSVISIVIHFAFKLDQQPLSLFKEIFTNKKTMCIIILHMILHSLALVAIIEVKKLTYLLLLTSLIPSLFYILTAKFTHPSKFL